ncbi:MAG: glycosyltransferase, partial [Bdellovibrionales bacterium]|nr:glycosyltransferase [Bdellovibrionales bacterium]
MNQEILISIIIPAFNEEAAIPDVIKKIKAVNFENAEIIVV